MIRTNRLAALTVVCAASLQPALAMQVFQASGADAASIQGKMDSFRAAVGGGVNFGPGVFAGGRREINWDAVPDALSDPAFMPNGQFNGAAGGSARGITFQSSGGVKTSADSDNPSGSAPTFGLAEFTPFSAERIFAPIGSTSAAMSFSVPGSSQEATVSSFGAVFLGVEVQDSTRIEAFNRAGQQIGIVNVEPGAFVFAGFQFTDGQQVERVLVRNGTQAIGTLGGGDYVAMDDFLYSEPLSVLAPPVPEPATYGLMAAGLLLVAGVSRRHLG